MEPYRRQLLVVTIGTSIEGAADRCLGQLYAVLGRVEEADRHYSAAIRLEESMSFAPLAARTRYWQARLLGQSTSLDDRRRAAGLLLEAQSTASQLGMVLLQQQASDLLRVLDLGQDTRSPATRPY